MILNMGGDHDISIASDDEFFDESKHKRLIRDIKSINGKKYKKEKCGSTPRTDFDGAVTYGDLIGSIKSTRNVNELKRKLMVGIGREACRDQPSFTGSTPFRKARVLGVPLHHRARTRIESGIVYSQAKREINQWNPIVNNFRASEQLVFPLNQEDLTRRETAADKAASFQPRTDFEKKIAEVLSKSKYNLTNEDEFCEAEKELLRAMDAKEAKRKCAELQKMRALMNYRAIKLRRESRIKSKKYHRIRKRQKRKQIIKEFEEILVSNPDKAKEKLKVLETERIIERGTLKHRGTNKWSKQMKQYASRNPEFKRIVEENFKLGKEMKNKQSLDSEENSSESEDEPSSNHGKMTTGELVKLSVEEANNFTDIESRNEKLIEAAKDNPFLRSALENIRRDRREHAKLARKIGTKSDDKEKQQECLENGSQNIENLDESFLNINSRNILQIPTELIDGGNNAADFQQKFIAQAYEDDDVLDDFHKEKERVEQEERPKDKEVSLAGWGHWTGPGIDESKRSRSIIKAKPQKRKDSRKSGVIIREAISQGVSDLQPRDVPFPFTTIKDYEAFIQQPLGPEWNTPIAQENLLKSTLVTKAGRIIRPVDKNERSRYVINSEDDEAY